MSEDVDANYDVFRECVSAAILEKSKNKSAQGRRRSSQSLLTTTTTSTTSTTTSKGKEDGQSSSVISDSLLSNDPDPAELADFIDYLATEIFTSLPTEARTLTHHSLQANASLTDRYTEPLSPALLENFIQAVPLSVPDTLTAYSILTPPSTDLTSFLTPILAAYISTVTARPSPWISTRTSACEICDRDWVPLTYHHLIPRAVHAKVLKRRWHEEHQLNSVAWLCRACHSFVHGMAGNEELARKWFTVELICEREETRRWAQWVGGVRWKKR